LQDKKNCALIDYFFREEYLMATTLAEKKTESLGVYILKLAIAFFFIFGFGYVVPTWSTVTELGVQAIGIFIGLVFLFTTGFSLAGASLLGLFGILLTGYKNASGLIAATLGSSTVFQLILMYAMIYGINKTGAGEVVAKWLITRKFTKGKPLAFTLMFFIACAVCGAFIGVTGTVLFTYAIIDAIAANLGYEKSSRWYKLMLLGTFTVSSVGSAALPFKGIALIIFGAMNSGFSSSGIEVTFGAYLVDSIIFTIIFAVAYSLCMKTIFRADMSKLKNFDPSSMENLQNIRFNREQLYICVGFLVAVLYTVVIMVIPTGTVFYQKLNSITFALWLMFIIAILSFVRIDGKPFFSPEKCLTGGITWGIVLAVCAFSVVGGMLSEDLAGIKEWLTLILNPIFGNMAFPVFMLIMVFVTTLITNFFSNTATGLIIASISSPFIISYSQSIGVSPTGVCAALVLAANFAYLTMAASGTAPLFLAHEVINKDSKFVYSYGVYTFFLFVILNTIVFTILSYIF